MPQIVLAATQAAALAPTVAPVVAGAGTGLAAAGSTAALEATKQAVIQEGMKQAGQAGIQQAAQTAATEVAKQSAVEASKQGIAQGFQKMLPQAADDAASLAVQSGSDAARNQAIEAFKSAAANPNKGIELGKVAGEVTSLPPPAGTPPYPTANMPVNPPAPASPAPVATTPPPAGNVSPIVEAKPYIPGQPDATRPFTADQMMQNELRQSAARTAERFAAEEAAANMSPLEKGFQTALKFAKDKPEYVGMGLMSLGQYMNQPEEEDKGKYKNKVDMSEFEPSLPSVGEFKPSYEYQKYAAEGGLMGYAPGGLTKDKLMGLLRKVKSAIKGYEDVDMSEMKPNQITMDRFEPSYEYQKYAVGGPVEQMAAMNAVGANTGYPMAGINTAMYSNPIVQRPEAVNVISPSGDAGVTAYSGEPKFAEGGISEEMAREYGLKTRKQRAAKSLTKDYEEMEAQRTKEANELLSERSGSGIIPRSRTQMLSSPYSAAIEEHNRLAKKTKTPKFELAKTSLGDIDTYMDIPVEAARGGIMGNLGSYSDGGRLLRGPGDGVSDSIPAVIGKRQPARLADGEFVIPARIVSELGNGSTEAGARKLYAMMERIQNTRKKSIGKKKVAVNSRADKHLPA